MNTRTLQFVPLMFVLLAAGCIADPGATRDSDNLPDDGGAAGASADGGTATGGVGGGGGTATPGAGGGSGGAGAGGEGVAGAGTGGAGEGGTALGGAGAGLGGGAGGTGGVGPGGTGGDPPGGAGGEEGPGLDVGVGAAGGDGPGLDAGFGGAPPPDAGTPEDAEVPLPDFDFTADASLEPARAFVTGQVVAADGRTPVTVSSRGVSTVADPDEDGLFRLGPLPPGPARILVDAPGHQPEGLAVEVPAEGEVAANDAPLVLYRGRRLSRDAARRLIFHPEDRWLLWEVDARLRAGVPVLEDVEPEAPWDLVADAYEVFLGFAPGLESITIRRRTMPGIAGDIDLVGLDDAEATPLFVEAQPWVRWAGERALAMRRTRSGLSHLESVVPGVEGSRVELAESVPWLLVELLADGRIAFADGLGPAFTVRVVEPDGQGALDASDVDGPTGDVFLSATPGARGVYWVDLDGGLWRWAPETGAERLAEGVAPDPRPRFLGADRVRFWRPDGETTMSLHLWDADAGERLLVDGARTSSLRAFGDDYYVERPGDGLWYGTLEGDGATVIPADAVTYSRVGSGAIALVDGVPWAHLPGADGAPLPGEWPALSSLRPISGGATVRETLTGDVWYLPAPGGDGEPEVLVRGTDGAGYTVETGGAAIYVEVDGLYRRVRLPGGDGPEAVFDRVFDRLVPLTAQRVLGEDEDGGLWEVDPRTGASIGWAFEVSLFSRSARRGFVGYVCDRGVFVAPLQ